MGTEVSGLISDRPDPSRLVMVHLASDHVGLVEVEVDLATKAIVATRKQSEIHRDTINEFIFSKRDDRYILAASDDGSISVYDRVNSPRRYISPTPLEVRAPFLHSLALSEDDRLLVTGSFDYSIRILDFASGASLKVIKGFNKYPWRVAITTQVRGGLILTLHKLLHAFNATTGEFSPLCSLNEPRIAGPVAVLPPVPGGTGARASPALLCNVKAPKVLDGVNWRHRGLERTYLDPNHPQGGLTTQRTSLNLRDFLAL